MTKRQGNKIKDIKVSVGQGEERYRLLVEGAKEYAMMIIDPKGRVTDWNAGAQYLLGYTESEIIGKNFSRFFTLEDRKLGKPQIELQIALDKGHAEDENWLIRKDKSRFWASGLSMPLRDKADNLLGFAKIVRDLTDRKEMDQQRDDFVALVSHELKNPITSMKGFAGLLKKRLTQTQDDKSLLYLARLEEQINKQEALTRDLLNIAKIQSAGIGSEGTILEIDKLITGVVNELQPSIETHHIVVEGLIDKKVVGDEQHLGQVLVNLLTNAVKYSPSASEIIISLSATDTELTVNVHDFGIGIPRKHIKRVFDRFYRADNAVQERIAGFGLGLYLAAQIIQQHHGKIWVKSSVGKGSTFSFSLPTANVETNLDV